MAKPTATTAYTLKVTLNGVRPPVWRRIIVRSDTTLSELGAITEAAMGWEGCYGNLLEALADPKHPDHEDLTEWIGGEFDPELFDVAQATAAVQSPRPPDGW